METLIEIILALLAVGIMICTYSVAFTMPRIAKVLEDIAENIEYEKVYGGSD